MKCLGAYFQLEIRTYRERWVEGLAPCDSALLLLPPLRKKGEGGKCFFEKKKKKKSTVEMQHSAHNGGKK